MNLKDIQWCHPITQGELVYDEVHRVIRVRDVCAPFGFIFKMVNGEQITIDGPGGLGEVFGTFSILEDGDLLDDEIEIQEFYHNCDPDTVFENIKTFKKYYREYFGSENGETILRCE